MEEIVDLIKQKKKEGRTVFVCGNGGSAATAEHFTNDLFSREVKAICLNSNVSIMTMIANDFGYKYIFQRQLELYAKPKDLLIVFSCSGNSENIVEALKEDIESIAILGRGGKARKLASYVYLVSSDDYGAIESKHLFLAHNISGKVR